MSEHGAVIVRMYPAMVATPLNVYDKCLCVVTTTEVFVWTGRIGPDGPDLTAHADMLEFRPGSRGEPARMQTSQGIWSLQAGAGCGCAGDALKDWRPDWMSGANTSEAYQ